MKVYHNPRCSKSRCAVDWLKENNIDFEESGHNENVILEKAALVIKSPGIPDKAPLVKALKEKGIEIIDELEFAARFSKAKIIAVT